MRRFRPVRVLPSSWGSSWWLPALLAAVLAVVGGITLRSSPGSSPTAPAVRPPRAAVGEAPGSPPAVASPIDEACARIERAVIELAAGDSTRDATIDPGPAAEQAAVRDTLPTELRAPFDRWWARLRSGPGTVTIEPAPEIDAWFERTCPRHGP